MPASHGDVPKTNEEKEFLKAAEASGRMPSVPNKQKAYKAWLKLPKSSPFYNYKFEGRNMGK
jgi:hypothetical protein